MTSLQFRLPWQIIRHFSLPTQPSGKGLWSRRVQNIPELSINMMLERNESFTNKKWIDIRKELLNSRLTLSEINVDAVIIDRCIEARNKEAAINYARFLMDNNYKLNVAVIGKYLKLLYDHNSEMSEKEKEEVIKLCKRIREEHPILDAMTAESCALPLSLTKEWRQCVELHDMIQLTAQPRTQVSSALIGASFENDEPNLGWNYLSKMPPRLWPSSRVYRSYLGYCQRNSKNPTEFTENIERMFDFWKQYNIHPWFDDLKAYGDVLEEKFGWIGAETSIKSSGRCNNCGHNLENLQLTSNDFKYLSDIIMNKVLVGDDIYNKTSPEELTKFKTFIAASKPYDVVVDGLNAAYSLKNTRSNASLGKELASVVRAFKQQKKRILVLGRIHMNNWKSSDMAYVYQNSSVFLANNLSQDDPYLLYATLAGGLNTYFSSRDLMRQHKFLMNDPVAQQVFRLWQMTRQIVPRYIGMSKNKSLFLIYPPAYAPILQKDLNGWHIPCTLEQRYGTPPQTYEPPKHWYCLRKKSQPR